MINLITRIPKSVQSRVATLAGTSSAVEQPLPAEDVHSQVNGVVCLFWRHPRSWPSPGSTFLCLPISLALTGSKFVVEQTQGET